MRKTRRTSKVGENVRDALVEVFRNDLKEINIGLASITGVDVSPDLHFARVFISGFNEDETHGVVKELQKAKGRVRHFLGQRIHLRYTPELDFKYDETQARGGRIESILAEYATKQASLTSDDQNDETHDHPDDNDGIKS